MARGQQAQLADIEVRVGEIVDNVERVIRGKRPAIQTAVECLVAGGHLLIEDVPGVGKTVLAKSLARSVDGTWARIQFTPDLMPADVTGATVWDRATDEMRFEAGPVFANLVLGDEINRASPKTQSALLEAMEEGQVSVDGQARPLPQPHMVLATQNPIEFEGTYPLPEGQMDRFMARLSLGYPDRDTELDIIDRHLDDAAFPALEPVATVADVVAMREAARQVHIAPALAGYVVDLAEASRHVADLALGISPRGTIALLRLARIHAAASGRDYVSPDDVQELLEPVLAHRLVLTPEADLAGATTAVELADLIASVPIPTMRTADARSGR